MPFDALENELRRCPECGERLELPPYCDYCGWEPDDDADFDRDELGDDPEED